MIYTVTLNPSIDYIVRLDQVKVGSVNRMDSDDKFAGGKGINVSRVLKRLNIPNTATGFIGGFTGKFITDTLAEEEIETRFVQVAEDTRINVKIKADQETEINGTGPTVESVQLEELKAILSSLTAEDTVVFAGSSAKNLGNLGSYHELASMFMKIGGAAFGLMLPVFAGYVAYSIAEKPGLVAGFVAGAIAKEGFAFGKIPYAAGGEATSTLAGVSSGFLGALVGGFIAGALVLAIKKYVKVPRSLEGAKSILLLPLLGTILTGFVMLAVNIPMAAINTAMNDFLGGLGGGSAVLLGIVLGGMMAVDMGGPVNKAAYVFGTGTLAATVSSGGSVAMAAVMAGGMVPPLAIFVATLLFKDKFTKEERNSGLTNIIMGLSFITEGAIPFGAADPARAIPSFILGSAVAGGLVGLTGIKLMAPHGGIFVIALTSNALLYLVSVLVGAIVSGVVYGYLRKPQA